MLDINKFAKRLLNSDRPEVKRPINRCRFSRSSFVNLAPFKKLRNVGAMATIACTWSPLFIVTSLADSFLVFLCTGKSGTEISLGKFCCREGFSGQRSTCLISVG